MLSTMFTLHSIFWKQKQEEETAQFLTWPDCYHSSPSPSFYWRVKSCLYRNCFLPICDWLPWRDTCVALWEQLPRWDPCPVWALMVALVKRLLQLSCFVSPIRVVTLLRLVHYLRCVLFETHANFEMCAVCPVGVVTLVRLMPHLRCMLFALLEWYPGEIHAQFELWFGEIHAQFKLWWLPWWDPCPIWAVTGGAGWHFYAPPQPPALSPGTAPHPPLPPHGLCDLWPTQYTASMASQGHKITNTAHSVHG